MTRQREPYSKTSDWVERLRQHDGLANKISSLAWEHRHETPVIKVQLLRASGADVAPPMPTVTMIPWSEWQARSLDPSFTRPEAYRQLRNIIESNPPHHPEKDYFSVYVPEHTFTVQQPPVMNSKCIYQGEKNTLDGAVFKSFVLDSTNASPQEKADIMVRADAFKAMSLLRSDASAENNWLMSQTTALRFIEPGPANSAWDRHVSLWTAIDKGTANVPVRIKGLDSSSRFVDNQLGQPTCLRILGASSRSTAEKRL
jgi:hypothetical protein